MSRHEKPSWLEALAGRLLEQHLGATLRFRDTGSSPSEVDFDVVLPNGRVAALEVTSIRNRPRVEQAAAVQRHQLVRIAARHAWVLDVGKKTSIKALSRRA